MHRVVVSGDDQRRRQSGEARRTQRRGVGMGGLVGGPQIAMPAVGPFAADRARLRRADRFRRHARVEHGRDQYLACQRRYPLVARHQGKRRGQIAPGLLTRDEGVAVLGCRAILIGPEQHVERRLQRTGKRVGGRDRIFGIDDGRPSLDQKIGNRPAGIDRAGDERAAMKMEDERRRTARSRAAVDAQAHRREPIALQHLLRPLTR